MTRRERLVVYLEKADDSSQKQAKAIQKMNEFNYLVGRL